MNHVSSSRKGRVKQALAGQIIALAVVPYLISGWAPLEVAVGWAVAYGVVSFAAGVLLLRWSNRWIDQAWGTLVGVIMAFVPVSVLWWSPSPEGHIAVAIGCVLAHASFEQTALPVADLPEWRLGLLITGAVATISTFVVIGPLVAFGVGGLLIATTINADGTRKLKVRLESEILNVEQTASHDSLTGLLNRRGLAGALKNVENDTHSVLVVDVNRFKLINDTFGYAAGDRALVVLATELRQRLPQEWVLARHGGDEFVAVARGREPVPPSLLEPIDYTIDRFGNEKTLQLTVSAGISSGGGTDEISRTQREAGYALQAAKQRGDGLARFSGELKQQFDRTLSVFSSMATGFDESSLDADAQIIVSDDAVVGFEILARWVRSNGTRVGPAEFLAMAAENGLMPRVGDIMLQKAAAFAARFNHLPNAPFVSVNMTLSDLLSLDLVSRVDSVLDEHRVSPERLMIEITESEKLDHDRRWEETARCLRGLGIKVAIDDFGAGYSRMEKLHGLPVSHLKFDRAMVRAANGPLSEVLRGVTRFASELQVEVIAEGVETLDELTTMQTLGITVFQGWHFGYPASLDQVEQDFLVGRSRSGLLSSSNSTP